MPATALQRALPATIFLLVILSFAVPARFHVWADWAHDKLDIVVAPVSRPLAIAAAWLRGDRPSADQEAMDTYEREREVLRSELLRARQDNERLQQVIRDLQSGLELAKDASVRVVQAGVFGYGTDPRAPTLRVQAGTRQGIRANSFALAPGLQVVGRVLEVADRTCVVRPLVASGAESLAAVIIIKDSDPAGLKCTLSPVGDGTLRGPVQDRRDSATNSPIEPVVGQVVRLDDPTWPKAARMLLLGRVELVEPNPDQPLRRLVTVRPTIDHMERLSELVLWTPQGEDDAGGTP